MDLVDLKQMLIRIMPKKRLKMLKAEIDNDDKECDLPWGLAPALKSESTSTSNQRQQVKSTSTISMKPPDCYHPHLHLPKPAFIIIMQEQHKHLNLPQKNPQRLIDTSQKKKIF